MISITIQARDGSYTLPKGKSMVLRYRVYIHAGTTQEANIAERIQSLHGERQVQGLRAGNPLTVEAIRKSKQRVEL